MLWVIPFLFIAGFTLPFIFIFPYNTFEVILLGVLLPYAVIWSLAIRRHWKPVSNRD